jgi:hypothetical protein
MRRTLVLLALILTLVAPATPTAAAQPAQPDQAFVFFPDTGHNVGLQLKRFFDTYGGVAMFGPPLTELIVGADGLQVQYFERARLEYHPEALPEARVSVSRAGAILAADRTDPAFQWLAASPDPARDFFPASGHTLGGAFRWFWQTRGAIPLFGYPISEEFQEWDEAAGVQRLVQYFERARFEYHPELAGTLDEVTLTPVGRRLLERDPLALAATAPTTPVVLLGQAATGFSTSSYERVTNISRATTMVDGMIVPAGAEFSFNAVGDFSSANGFVEGYAIVGGQLEKVVGGGLCQVSTTLFRAVANAGLQVTRRVGHSHIVYFYENILGFDATVFTPSVDFRWRNDMAGPVYIVGTTDLAAARVTFQLYGTSDGRTVRYKDTIEKNWKRPGVAVWQLDRSLPSGAIRQLVHGRPGVDVTLTRVITMADGTTHVEPFVTRYTPWEDFYAYGPGVTPPSGVKVIAPKG